MRPCAPSLPPCRVPMSVLKAISPTPHAGEARAFEWLDKRLADAEPAVGWTNFEIVDRHGRHLEVDALVLTAAGIFLVEVKSWTGRLVAGPHHWDYTAPGGRRRVQDSPYGVTNLKAKVLAGLLGEHWRRERLDGRCPFVHTVIWLSEQELEVSFRDGGENHLVFHAGKAGLPAADHALLTGEYPGGHAARPPLNRTHARWLRRALDGLGIRPRQANREVQGWTLGDVLDEGPLHQDVLAHKAGRQRRVRFFLRPEGGGPKEAERVRRAARREFEGLKGLGDHAGVLVADDFVEHDRGPALLFRHPEERERLDHVLARRGADLDILQRLDLVRDLARAVQSAHSHGVVHRALCPQCVHVHRDWPEAPAGAVIGDWHTAQTGESTLTATRHIEDWHHERSAVYLAPEALKPLHRTDADPDPTVDVYGLGAILATLVTGQPPAPDLAALQSRWETERALAPSARMDGIDRALDQLVRKATAVRPADRFANVGLLADELDHLHARLSRALLDDAEDDDIDPLLARPGDVLGERFTVLSILGKGSTARALRVQDQESGEECVLKVALESRHHERLDKEANALRSLDSRHVVRLHDQLTFEAHDRRALLLEFGGEETLREKLRNRQLNLDELQRFGEELCILLEHLEARGVLHRDLKPENLGIHAADPKQARRLVAWDFSLAGTSFDVIDAGTPGYIDPFLRRADRPGVDEYADRWAAAITLHEMASGEKPTWPPGIGAPHLEHDARLRLAERLFPAAIADRLKAFFTRCFAPDHRARFETATRMREAWADVFATTTHGHLDTNASDLEALVATLTLHDPLSRLGLSPAAHDVLDAQGIHTLDDFVRLPGNAFIRLAVSGPVRTEISQTWAAVRRLIPGATRHEDEATGARAPEQYTLDDLADFLWKDRKRAALPTALQDLAEALLLSADTGAEADVLPPPHGEWRWPDPRTLARQRGVSLETLQAQLAELAQHWARKKFVAPLVADVHRSLRQHGGVLGVGELARALSGLRGCLDDAQRQAWSRAVVRAVALLVDHGLAGERAPTIVRATRTVFLVAPGFAAEHVEELGHAADLVLEHTSLLQPEVAWEELLGLVGEPVRAVLGTLGRARGLRVAALASETAASGARDELYVAGAEPGGLLPSLARRFTHVERVREGELREALAQRFPDARPLPGPPELDRLIRASGLGLSRLPEDEGGESVWAGRRVQAAAGSSLRSSTQYSTVRSEGEQERRLREVEHQLAWRRREGGFTALLCRARVAEALAPRLAAAHDLQLVSAEGLWLEALREAAAARKVNWSVVLGADAAAPGERAHHNLRTLLTREVIPRLGERLQALEGAVLLHRNGLFARYGAMALVERLREHAGRPGWPEVVWMLLPTPRAQERPSIDGTDVPVIHPSERYRLPRLWEERTLG
ncbi:MAG: BREX system serine/threonine kinase PglW [Deltaproteobacteria bacterium]|nr:MAG: BREX system serine/threonine kinase PglW [Deltaproteobacteria bacterium]